MSKKITLPSGATVTLKEGKDLKVKDRNKVIAAGDGLGTAERGIAIGNALLEIVIEDWSFDLIPPSVQSSSLGELSIPDYVALQKETESLTKDLFPEINIESENPDSPKDN